MQNIQYLLGCIIIFILWAIKIMNKLKLLTFVLLLVLCCGAIKNASAQGAFQGLSATTNFDSMPDDQIKLYMSQAQAAGLSDDQLSQMASDRGVPPLQIQHLLARVAEIRKKDATGGSSTGGADGAQVIRQLNDRDTSQSRLQNKTETLKASGLPVFGSNLFTGLPVFGSNLFNGASNTFEPNLKLPAPRNYILGPDDQIVVNIFGNNVAAWSLPISIEGNINIPNIGLVNVAGKTFEQASDIIKSKLIAANYSIGKGTNVQFSLGNIRSIKVIMQGECIKPGTYTIISFATVFNALSVAGGPNNIGSYRNIEVIRDGKIIDHMDLYDFLLKGSQKGNIPLKDQDIILVPTYDIRVELKGEVKRPALFETLPGETLQDLISYAGGFSDYAFEDHISVNRVNGQEREIRDLFETEYKSYIPKRGDRYNVDRILDRFKNRVTIKGAVFRPKDYQLQDGLTLSKLIANAGGLREDAFTARASIIRLKSDNSNEEISFNVADVLANKPGADQLLQREDIVTISSKFDLRDQYKVSIQGEVRVQGDYAYADSMQVADLIIRAGGLTEAASTKRISVSRRIYDSDPTNLESKMATVYNISIDGSLKTGEGNFILKPFDIVLVYTLPGYEVQKFVNVQGEVLYPGPYPIIKKNERISDIITRAYGLTASANIDGSSLRRDNLARMGTEKSKINTAELENQTNDRLRRLDRIYKDSTFTDATQMRNNFVGIDLRKILQNPGTKEDLIVESGDVLVIPKQLQTVKVNGEVLFPSEVVYENSKNLKDYVLNAGGFASDAFRRGAYVVYANGTVKGIRRFLFFNNRLAIKPGSEIYIPKMPPPKPANSAAAIALQGALVSFGTILIGILSLTK